jgi:hypothetical protein
MHLQAEFAWRVNSIVIDLNLVGKLSVGVPAGTQNQNDENGPRFGGR